MCTSLVELLPIAVYSFPIESCMFIQYIDMAERAGSQPAKAGQASQNSLSIYLPAVLRALISNFADTAM